MKKKSKVVEVALLIMFVVAQVALAWGVCTIASKHTHPMPEVQVVEVEKPANIDTSAIDAWCDGKLRLVEAWMYGTTTEGETIVEDETGNLWTITDTPINETDNLLLWITDNHTADNTEDDVIIKVWTEAHN